MNDKDRESILNKLEALFNVAEGNGSTDNEREQALKFAERLMMKHKIERSEVVREKQEADPITKHIVELYNGYVMAQVFLADALAPLAFCRSVKNGKGIIFVGTKTDIDMANTLFASIWFQLWNDCNRDFENSYTRLHGRKWKTDYLQFAANRIRVRVKEMIAMRNANTEEKAIVLVTDGLLKSWMEQNMSLSMIHTRRAYSPEAAEKGRNAADRAELSGKRMLE